MTAPNGGPVVVDVGPALAGHLAVAIRRHREWADSRGWELPSGLTEFEQYLASKATRGQSGPALDQLWQARDGDHVTPRLLTYEDAASALACSDRTVKRLVAGGQLHAVRVGGTARIRVTDLDAYVDGLPSTLAEITGDAPCQS